MSEIDWNSTIDIAATPEQNDFMPDLKEDSEDSENWAQGGSASPSPSLSSKHRFEEDRQTHDTSDICTIKKKTLLVSIRKEGQRRNTSTIKKQHNDIERKYPQTINSKLAELDHWLLDHQSKSGTCNFTLITNYSYYYIIV